MKFAVVIASEAPLSDPVLYRGNIFNSAEKARLAGCGAVEIHTKNVDEFDSDALLSYCHSSGMRIAAFATGMVKRIDGLSFIDEREDIRNAAIERVCGFVKFASPFSAGIIIGSMRGMIPDKSNRKTCDDRFYYCMSKIVEIAEKYDVPIFLEVINRYENNYLNTAEETLEFIRPLDSDKVKIHLDTFHMNIEETDMNKAILICGNKLGHIHLADNTRHFLGSGTINFKKVIEAAESIGYDGYYSLEYLSKNEYDSTVHKSVYNIKQLFK